MIKHMQTIIRVRRTMLSSLMVQSVGICAIKHIRTTGRLFSRSTQ